MGKILAPFILILIGSCAAIIPPTPITPAEKLVVAEEEYKAVLRTIDRLLDEGILDGDSATKTLEALSIVRTSLAAFRTAVDTGADSSAELRAFNNSIFLLIKYLEKEEGSVQYPHSPQDLRNFYISYSGNGRGCRADC